MKRFIIAAMLAVLLGTTNVFAQTEVDADQQTESEVSAVIKVSGISPAVGAEVAFDEQNRLRALGFFSINSSAARDNYHLDLSYLRTTDWLNADGLKAYGGINMHLQFEDPVIGPGVLVGALYNLSDQVAVFGEAGLNVFISDDGNNAIFGMLNSGIGLKVQL